MLDVSNCVGLVEARRRLAQATTIAIACRFLLDEPPQLVMVPRSLALRTLARRDGNTVVICELRANGLCVLGQPHA